MTDPTPGRSPGAGVRSVVLLHRVPTRGDRQRLQSTYGLALTDYLPPLSYVESVAPEHLDGLRHDPLVRAVTAYGQQFRRALDGPRRRMFSSPAARGRPARMFEAVLFADADPVSTSDALRQRGAREPYTVDDRHLGGAAKIRFAADDPASFDDVDDVRWLDELGEVRHDAAPTESPPLARAWAQPLWRLGLSGSGQVIGVIDSPIDPGHRFFADPAHPIGPQHRKLTGYRSAGNRPPALHGTFVAGIVAGDDPAAPGADPGRGVAWAARLSYGDDTDVERLGVLGYLAAAADEGAAVHTNSWHDEPDPQYNQLAADLDGFAWRHEDQLIVASAGNRGERMGPPGTAKNVLSVAASQGPAPSVFGDGATGPSADGRTKPEVMAPGCSIRSAVAGTAGDVALDQQVFGSAVPICASSWAAPAVAGLAALVRQYFVDGFHPSGHPVPADAIAPTGALVRAVLLAGCRNDPPVEAYPSRTGGWGTVRLDDVLRPGRLLVHDVRHADGLATGETATLRVAVRDAGTPLAVALVWTDPPGPAGCAAPAVNTLALTVTQPGGGRPIDGSTGTGTARRLLVADPEPGEWTVTVSAESVPVGNPGQGFAVTVVGALADVQP